MPKKIFVRHYQIIFRRLLFRRNLTYFKLCNSYFLIIKTAKYDTTLEALVINIASFRTKLNTMTKFSRCFELSLSAAGFEDRRTKFRRMASATSNNVQGDHDREYIRSIHLILMILSCFFFLLGVLGNAAVIIYNIYLNYEKTLSSWLVTNLATADLLVCLTIYPKTITRYFLCKEKFDDVFDKLNRSTQHVSLFLSTTMLLSITVDKYVFIARPLRYLLIVTSQRVKAVLCAIWLTAAAQLPIVYIYSKGERRWEKRFRPNAVNSFQLSRIIMLSIFILVIAILNYKMLKIAQQQRKCMASVNVVHPEQERPAEIRLEQAEPEQLRAKHNVAWLRRLVKQMKAIKTFAIIFGVLTICFIPYFVVTILASTCSSCLPEFKSSLILYFFALQVVGINSIANAFIYALRHRKYSRAYNKLLSAIWERVTK